jgi:hypothetical protein
LKSTIVTEAFHPVFKQHKQRLRGRKQGKTSVDGKSGKGLDEGQGDQERKCAKLDPVFAIAGSDSIVGV